MSEGRGRASTYAAIGALFGLALLFAVLGNWQLERAATSRATLEQFAAGSDTGGLERLPRELDAALRFRRIEVAGEYVAEPQFLLDNMLHDGVAGYHVLTALRVPGLRERLLVNRGWVPAGGDRRRLPDVAIEAGPQRLSGTLDRLPRPGLRLGDGNGTLASAPVLVLQYPTAAELARLLGEPVLDYQLQLGPDQAGGYVRDWRAPVLSPERHLSYAGQWLALSVGAFAAAIVMAVRTARQRS